MILQKESIIDTEILKELVDPRKAQGFHKPIYQPTGEPPKWCWQSLEASIHCNSKVYRSKLYPYPALVQYSSSTPSLFEFVCYSTTSLFVCVCLHRLDIYFFSGLKKHHLTSLSLQGLFILPYQCSQVHISQCQSRRTHPTFQYFNVIIPRMECQRSYQY